MTVISITIWYTDWWMIYFKYRWTYFTLQLQWQQILNPKIVTQIEKENWYIHNNNKYGNLSHIYKLFGTIYFIAFTTSSIALMLITKPNATDTVRIIAMVMNFIVVLPPILFYIILVWKTPFINDTFHIINVQNLSANNRF